MLKLNEHTACVQRLITNHRNTHGRAHTHSYTGNLKHIITVRLQSTPDHHHSNTGHAPRDADWLHDCQVLYHPGQAVLKFSLYVLLYRLGRKAWLLLQLLLSTNCHNFRQVYTVGNMQLQDLKFIN